MTARLLATAIALLTLAAPHAVAVPISDALDALVNGGRLAGTDCRTGVVILDPATGRILAEHNPDRSLIPASNMKLVTSGTALALLGPEFTFETTLAIDDTDDQTPATVVLTGAGDPALADPKLLREMGMSVEDLLDAWASAVIDSGVQRVDAVVVDDRIFDREFVHPTWPVGQLNRWYCAEVAGINFHTNCLSIFTNPGEPGRPPLLRTEPILRTVEIRNRARSVSKGQHTVWAARKHESNEITLYGDVRRSSLPVEVTLHDIPARLAEALADRLRDAGIEVEHARVAEPAEPLPAGRVVHRTRTPLRVALARCNEDSQNLYAEALFKRVGHEITRAPGSWATGAAVTRMALLERLGAASGQEITVADGSGMSRENRVTTRMIADWLASFWNDDHLRDHYLESLPIGGEEGTLRKRFRGKSLTGDVRAKSGYLSGVSALSGFVVHPDTGQAVVFSVITNDKPNNVPLAWVREFEEEVVLMADRWLREHAAANATAAVDND